MYVDTKELTLDFIKPLCKKTQELFAPLAIRDSDRIKLSLTKDGKHFRAEMFAMRPSEDGGLLRTYASYEANVRFPQRIPERRKFSEKAWQFSSCDMTALLIAFHWDQTQISFTDELSRQTYTYLLARFYVQTKSIQKRNSVDDFRFLDHPTFPLTAYQKRAFFASMNNEGFGLFMEQGTGKTAVCIARIMNECLRKDPGSFYKAIIVCPKNVRENWVAEFHKFATVAGRVTVIRGDKLNRYKGIVEAMMKPRANSDEHYTIVIISYDSVDKTFDPIKLIDWDLCILDESHYIKNTATKRWKAMRLLRDKCTARMVLTGTPITNSMLDLYTQFEFMGEGWSGFSSYKAFKDFYGIYAKQAGQNQAGFHKLIGLGNVPMIQERLARQSYLIKKSEALPDLPEKMYNVVEVEMSREQKDMYREVCDNLMVEIENDMAAADTSQKQVLMVSNTLVKMLRLAQITSGHITTSEVVDDEGNVIQEKMTNRFDPNPKLETLVKILKEKTSEQKTLIWACFIQDIKSISARLRLEGINCREYRGATSDNDRKKAETDFNCDPDCKVLIGNPAAGGTGLNLLGYDHSKRWYFPGGPATACDHVIYFSQDWSGPFRWQSEDRAHRRGTVRHVQYTDLVVPMSIDLDIRLRVTDKRLGAMKIQDIRAILNRIMAAA